VSLTGIRFGGFEAGAAEEVLAGVHAAGGDGGLAVERA
jgi:hypothetical protein